MVEAPFSWAERTWDEEKLSAFSQEIDQIKRDIEGKMGEEDLVYLKKMEKKSILLKSLGRTLLHFSLDPVTWSAGVLSLWIGKQINTAEIGHYALHGAWDNFPAAEKFHAKKMKWDCPVEEDSWRHGHNILHHQFTNIVGKDPDVNYVTLRLSKETKWAWHHAFQVVQFFAVMPAFFWVMNPFFTGVSDLLRRFGTEGYTDVLQDRKLKTVTKAIRQSLKKATPYFIKNYILWPMLAGPMWWKVLTGNFLADVLRDSFLAAAIYGGHFGEDLKFYPKAFKAHGRGEWYKQQVETTHDFHNPGWLSKLCGALDYQIEHHLFPKFPPNRLREVASRVQKLCEKFGLAYQNDSWFKTLKKAVRQVAKMSFPNPALA